MKLDDSSDASGKLTVLTTRFLWFVWEDRLTSIFEKGFFCLHTYRKDGCEYKGEVKGWFVSMARAPAGCKNVQWLMDEQWYYKTCTNCVQASRGFLPLKNLNWSPDTIQLRPCITSRFSNWCYASAGGHFTVARGFLSTAKVHTLWFLKYPANLKTDPKTHCSLPGGERGFQISAHPSIIPGKNSRFSTGSRACL